MCVRGLMLVIMMMIVIIIIVILLIVIVSVIRPPVILTIYRTMQNQFVGSKLILQSLQAEFVPIGQNIVTIISTQLNRDDPSGM